MSRTRAERRFKERQLKSQAREILKNARFDERRIGKFASTHGRPCSCMGCKRGDPRHKLARSAVLMHEDFMSDEHLDHEEFLAAEGPDDEPYDPYDDEEYDADEEERYSEEVFGDDPDPWGYYSEGFGEADW